jgi:hypothetical protein
MAAMSTILDLRFWSWRAFREFQQLTLSKRIVRRCDLLLHLSIRSQLAL